MKSRTCWIPVTSMGFAVLLAWFVMMGAFDHNPQGVFFDQETRRFDAPYATLLFGTWFVLGWLASAVALILVRALLRRAGAAPREIGSDRA